MIISMRRAIDGMARATEAVPGARRRARALNLANTLTLARILAVPFVVIALADTAPAARWTALVLFIAAAVTDYLDGLVARALDQRSALGRMLDPIADKLVVAAVLVMLAADGTIAGVHLWACVIILAREILISGLREFLGGAVVVPVVRLAKWKTAAQFLALTVLIAAPLADGPAALDAGRALLWLAAALSVVTAYDYMKAGLAHVLREEP
jgi:CDP-diacylglycerol--glycerol-3-phosphate 3-phosphatidyltransferase/cardiolipin synthase